MIVYLGLQADFMNGFQGTHYKFMVTDKTGFIGFCPFLINTLLNGDPIIVLVWYSN